MNMSKLVFPAIVVAILIFFPLAVRQLRGPGNEETGSPSPDSLTESDPLRAPLSKTVSVSIASSPDGGRLTVQFAVMEVCRKAGISYQWEKSRLRARSYCRKFVRPVRLRNVTAEEALAKILSAVDGRYDIDADGLYLY